MYSYQQTLPPKRNATATSAPMRMRNKVDEGV